MTTQTVTLANVLHERVSVDSNGKQFVMHYVYRARKDGSVVRAMLNPHTHRDIIRRIDAACSEVNEMH